MKLLVLGATGGTGRQLVARALARGHEVTALVRSPDKMGVTGSERLKVVQGDPLQPTQVTAALSGQDAILSALGPRSGRDDRLIPAASEAMVRAMVATGVDRALIVSSALLYPQRQLIGRVMRALIAGSLRGAAMGEAQLQRSDARFTIVRPVRLTDAAPTGRARVFRDRLPPAPLSVARADVADVLLDAVEQRLHTRAIVGVCG